MIAAMVVTAALIVLCALERVRPLRRRVQDGVRRVAANLGLWGVSVAVLAVLDRPVTSQLARHVEQEGFGLVPALGLPSAAAIAVGLVLLDYTNFIWHALLHRLPILWRFHQVHHADLDLDVFTALRFHAGEITASVVWRTGQVLLLGINPVTLAAWHSVLFVNVLFHHSNLRLPAGFERVLSLFLMTPRLHGIHHSVVSEEMNSNLSSGLTLWDRVHRTLRADVPQERITIGIADARDPQRLGLVGLLMMPFSKMGVR